MDSHLTGASEKQKGKTIMTQYEMYLKQFHDTLSVVEKALQGRGVPITSRLIAAELLEVRELVRQSVRRLEIVELDALSVADFADALCEQITLRAEELLNEQVQ